jgi:hypothetical protein
MTMQNESLGDAKVLPTDCPWCLAVAALVLTAATVLIFFW